MIKVNDDYTIKAYSQGYKVYKNLHRQDSKGKDIYDFLGYATNVGHALGVIQRRMERERVDEKEMSLKEAIDEFKAIHDSLFHDYISIEQTIKNYENSQS